MNKLITKVVGAALGLAMAVGVGVGFGVDSSKEAVPAHAATVGTTYDVSTTAATSIVAGKTYVIASGTTGNVFLAAKGSSTWGTAVNKANAYIFSAESITNGFALKSDDGYLNPRANNKNTFLAYTSTQPKTAIVLLTGNIVGTYSTEYPLRQNSTSGFRWYGKGNTTGTAAYLYEATKSTSTDCSVTYSANGGSGTMTDPNSPYAAGSNVTILGNSFAAPSGFEFAGWNTSADGTGTSYSAGATVSNVSSGLILYAQWSEIADSYLHDVLDASDFNATTTSYVETSDIAGTESTAIYCGNTAKGNQVIQLNTSYGIGTSSIGGLLRKIKVVWDSNTASGRSLSVKGSETAYTATTCTSGKEIGTISYNSTFLSTIALFDSSTYYPYICISGVGGAVYLESIDFGFEPVNPTSITVSGDSSVYIGKTITLTATPVHSSGWSMTNTEITWSSSDSNIASVSTSGVVTGVGAGTATITAKSVGDNAVVGSHTVTVSEVPTNYIHLSVKTDTGTNYGYVGDGIYVTVDDSNLVGNINWSVSGGTLSEQTSDDTALIAYLASAGTITITAMDSLDNSNTASVVVNSIAALNSIDVQNISTKTWNAEAATDFGAKISSINGTDSGTLTFDDSSTMSYTRTLEYLASGKADYLGFSNPYIQFGSSNALESLTLTTSTSLSNVSKVVVNCGSANGASTVSVTVGGNAFDTPKSAPSTKAEVSFNGSASGVVEITMTKSTKTGGCAQYISSVAITCSDGTSVNIANKAGYHTAQSAVIEFAQDFIDDLGAVCVAFGSTDVNNLTDTWSNLSSQFTNWFVNTGKNLTATDKERALLMFANATATPRTADGSATTGDVLQNALNKYEWIVEHYLQCNDFLNETADRVEVPRASKVSFNGIGIENGSVSAIIVIVSLVSITAIGGYFFVRKSKEQQ